MCGFAVFIGQNGRAADRCVVKRMTETLVHRGPNDSGFWDDGSVAMGFRRLSILDLSSRANQPMRSLDGTQVIAFNGEIFNYVELRDELRTLGHQFATTSDTEVLLASWRQWGDTCVDRLEGMFAFVIWDSTRKELFGARDRFGIKPLYTFCGPDVVLLASEIKAIQASGLYETRPNWPIVSRYLLDGHLDETTATCFEQIEQIAPAHAFRIGLRGPIRSHRYFDFPASIQEVASEGAHTVADMLENSVRTRMRSDVPVGVCLSGGIDSTAIICAMARHRRESKDPSPLVAFNYNTPEFDESAYIAETIRQTGATLVSWDGKIRDLWSNLPRVLHFHDEPLHSMNALVGFELMGLARERGAIVLLNGQGADETLGGYSSYYDYYWSTLLIMGRVDDAWREIRGFAKAFEADATRLAARVLRRVALRAMRHVPAYTFATTALRKCA
ncbi:MAG TPA: asparagine synthase (glutamine-hydrolyzing), partial [Gemmatimonadaceae bacterium]